MRMKDNFNAHCEQMRKKDNFHADGEQLRKTTFEQTVNR